LVEPRDLAQLGMRVIGQARACVQNERVALVLLGGRVGGVHRLLVHGKPLVAETLEDL